MLNVGYFTQHFINVSVVVFLTLIAYVYEFALCTKLPLFVLTGVCGPIGYRNAYLQVRVRERRRGKICFVITLKIIVLR